MSERTRGYAIGTVANLTGLDPHTIRAWERRYEAVRPDRSAGGARRYRDEDVARLQLLKALTECGEPIGSVAGLEDAVLRSRLERMAGLSESLAPREARRGPLRVALLHPRIAEQIRAHGSAPSGLQLSVREDALEAFVSGLHVDSCDVVIVGLELLGREPLRALERISRASGGRPVLIVYQFARRAMLAQLGSRGARLVRGPLRLEALGRNVLDLFASDGALRSRGFAPLETPRRPNGRPAPERRFGDRQLARLAEIASAVDCECPNHLASIVTNLVAFERYAGECENRDQADARLHARLALGTSLARDAMERLLAEVCEQDGIEV